MTATGPLATIHQPECLPWLGFIDKALRAEIFILLDDVQYARRYFQNRNRIRTAQGWQYLTVPVKQKSRYDQLIKDVEIDNQTEPRWREKHLQAWKQHYGKAPFADRYLPFLESHYAREWTLLADFNIAIIRELFAFFGVTARVARSSELASEGAAARKLLTLCRSVGASTYLSGISGRDYLKEDEFAQAGIGLLYQEFHHPVYAQRYEPFEACMTSFDFLFNAGPKARELLLDSASPRLESVFL